jgi:multimeric flavodoxin WrbA
MNKTVIVVGSSRSKGNTTKIVNYISATFNIDVIDLNTKKIGYFDYDFKNSDDDFIPLMTEIIEKYNTIIFATPVYWYSMSGILKVFFDRFSDLLHYQKELGRKMRGKNMAMLSCSNSNDLKEGFSMPFKESANYLGMNYLGAVHTWLNDDGLSEEVIKNLETFLSKINTFE